TDDEFRPLRLQNGLYVERHGPMIRLAIPYGLLSSTQLRKLAHVSRRYDRSVGHLTTRQNIQFNWVKIEEAPDLLAELAEVEMHAIQTSGSCIRAITTDAFAGVAPDEIADPRPWCEILRQWSSFHPEFAYLPRKFKIAVSASQQDRAVTQLHDIGLQLVKNDRGETGFRVLVGGGMGRTPILGEVIHSFLPWQHLLTYCDAILRVYNRYGRRDNLYKARIKILVKALGADEFARQVEAEWLNDKDGPATLTENELQRVAAHFAPPAYKSELPSDLAFEQHKLQNKAFAAWVKRNVHPHQVAGYAAVTLSLKARGAAPGDLSDGQMEQAADLADLYSFGQLRVSHEQNLVLADVRIANLYALWEGARAAGFATPTVGLLTDMIACPGGDFCSLANARSLPIADAIQQQFDSLDYLHDIGDLDLKISGCVNACGHHHVGHIGILGVDKNDQEFYQITIGGDQGSDAAIGKIIGRSFPADQVPGVLATLLDVYVAQREGEERFIDTVRRIGVTPFSDAVYGRRDQPAPAPEIALQVANG
ncbi:MAG TPA: nitrite/sulfite reductase, partial [Rhodocyclaceae bacterium]|nr:nitrite/sulfite reductase [Rhodocyclaceae bacterium]